MSMIDLVVLGTGAMVPLPQRWLSSFMLRIGSSMILFDCGEGTQIAMREVGWGFAKLDAIVLSHHHADHVAGIPGLLHTLANAGRTEPLHMYGPPHSGKVVHGLRVIARHLPYEVIVHELEGGDSVSLPGGLEATTAWADHWVPCLAWRLDLARPPAFNPAAATRLGVPRQAWSRLQRGETIELGDQMIDPAEVLGGPRRGLSLGFATDTRPTDGIVDLVRGVDLFVCEGTYTSSEYQAMAESHRHMTFEEAATMARRAGVRRLLLTHFSARIENPADHLDSARTIFPDTETAFTGYETSLRFTNTIESDAIAPASQSDSRRS
jgi:ribonuclease Z